MAVAAQIATAIATAARMTGAAAGHVIQTAEVGTRASVAMTIAGAATRASAVTTSVVAGTRASAAMTTVVGDATAEAAAGATTIAALRARPTPANTHASSAPA